jgi:hypothetical protein
MPRRELKYPAQVEAWLADWGKLLREPGELVLIGSGALLWHAFQLGIAEPLPENSMDVDPVTDCEEIAFLAYEALIGSDFELANGWHVNLMPRAVLNEMPGDWILRASKKQYGKLHVTVPAMPDLLVPKLKRGEPRDKIHAEWARKHLLCSP